MAADEEVDETEEGVQRTLAVLSSRRSSRNSFACCCICRTLGPHNARAAARACLALPSSVRSKVAVASAVDARCLKRACVASGPGGGSCAAAAAADSCGVRVVLPSPAAAGTEGASPAAAPTAACAVDSSCCNARTSAIKSELRTSKTRFTLACRVDDVIDIERTSTYTDTKRPQIDRQCVCVRACVCVLTCLQGLRQMVISIRRFEHVCMCVCM